MSVLLPWHSRGATAGSQHGSPSALSMGPGHQAQGHQAASGAAEIQGDFDVATRQGDKSGQGQGDCRQPGLLHNRPLADPLGKDPAGTLHGQPQSRAAGTAAGLGTIAAPTPERDILPARGA